MLRKGFLYGLMVMLLVACGDKIRKFTGFTQEELEYLLASDVGKAWERIYQEEEGVEIPFDDCGMNNFLIFWQGSVGDEKPLLYAYDPRICDSLEFCNQRPDFCEANVTLCAEDPEFCDLFSDEVLYIGSWYAKEPFIENDRSDTLVFNINNQTESIFVTNITSQQATFQYKARTGSGGGLITEYYTFTPSN